MECKHFGECGACRLNDGEYDTQLQYKIALNKDRFASCFQGDIEVFRSDEEHYRYRSEFQIWHVGDEIHYAMHHQNRKGVVLIEECPQVSKPIAQMMPKVLEALKRYDLAHKLFGADFLSSSSGEIVLSLLYHRKLDEAWQQAATEMAQELEIHIIGRARKQKVVCGQDFVTELLRIHERTYQFRYIENSFTQPNSRVNEKMITWALESFEGAKGDLLELYCGAGNFTIPFASYFEKILATEISKSSIAAAKENMVLNQVDNIEFVRMSVEEFVDALEGVREFNRMRHLNLQAYDLQSVFVDPPRAGMDSFTCKFVARYDTIVYISCNPETLHRDLALLTQTHEVQKMALFDQFPYTHHVEMGVKLVKR